MEISSASNLADIVKKILGGTPQWLRPAGLRQEAFSQILKEVKMHGDSKQFIKQANMFAARGEAYDKLCIVALVGETISAFVTTYYIENTHRLYVLGAYILAGTITALLSMNFKKQGEFYKTLADAL